MGFYSKKFIQLFITYRDKEILYTIKLNINTQYVFRNTNIFL